MSTIVDFKKIKKINYLHYMSKFGLENTHDSDRLQF